MNYQDEVEDEHKQPTDPDIKSSKSTQRESRLGNSAKEPQKIQEQEWEPDFEMVILGIREPILENHLQRQGSLKPSRTCKTELLATPLTNFEEGVVDPSIAVACAANSRPKTIERTVRETQTGKGSKIKRYQVSCAEYLSECSYHITPGDLLPIAKQFTL